jgi:hypothetical protein
MICSSKKNGMVRAIFLEKNRWSTSRRIPNGFDFWKRGVKFFKKEIRMFLKSDDSLLRLSFGK